MDEKFKLITPSYGTLITTVRDASITVSISFMSEVTDEIEAVVKSSTFISMVNMSIF